MHINEFDYQNLDALFGDYKERAQKLLNEKIDLNKLAEVLFGIYEQAQEWIQNKPILRRSNLLFIPLQLAENK